MPFKGGFQYQNGSILQLFRVGQIPVLLATIRLCHPLEEFVSYSSVGAVLSFGNYSADVDLLYPPTHPYTHKGQPQHRELPLLFSNNVRALQASAYHLSTLLPFFCPLWNHPKDIVVFLKPLKWNLIFLLALKDGKNGHTLITNQAFKVNYSADVDLLYPPTHPYTHKGQPQHRELPLLFSNSVRALQASAYHLSTLLPFFFPL